MPPDANARSTTRALKQDERYRVLAESAPDAIVTIDEESTILSVNPATERIFGWSADELVGRRLPMLMPEQFRDRHAAGMARFIATGNRHLDWRGVALPGLRKDGTEFPMEVSFGEFVDGGRHIFSGFMRDVSDRVEQQQRIDRATSELQRALQSLEQRVQEAEEARQSADDANAAKGQFLRMMSHELRTPLNAIGGYVDLLEAGLRGPVTPAQRDDLVRIRSAQGHLLSLINDVLNFAKLEQGPIPVEIRPMPVSGLLDSLEGMIAPQLRSKEIRFECKACDTGLTVSADRQKLGQIMLNLLSNAVKFTPARGHIVVSAKREEGSVLISVIDNGAGIPSDQHQAVFQPFVQVDSTLTRVHGGSGLGLSISRELAHAMGGTITVESKPGAGAAFTVSLPAANTEESDGLTV